MLNPHGVAVFVIGDVADPGKDPLPLATKIWQDLGSETGLQLIELIEDHLPVQNVQNKVSPIWGETKGQATARIVRSYSHVMMTSHIGSETIDWDEPYKDGDPTPPMRGSTRCDSLR